MPAAFGVGFLQGFTGAAQKKIDQQHEEDENRKKELRQGLWKIAYDTTGQYNDAVKQNALNELNKLYGPEGKKGLKKVSDIFARMTGGQQQPAQSQGAQPNQLPVPAGAQPPTANAAPQSAQSQQPAGAQAAAPAPASSGASPRSTLSSPRPSTPPQTAQNGGFSLPPITSQSDIDAAQQRKTQQEEAKKTFDTNEQIRLKKAEDDDAATRKHEERNAQFKEIEADPRLTDDEKREARLRLYGITNQPGSYSDVHYQDQQGNWHPAQHDPKTGKFFDVDGRTPIDPAQIKDVRQTAPDPEKDSTEVKDLTAFYESKAGGSLPHDQARTKALADRKKELETKQAGVVIRNEAAAAGSPGGPNTLTDDELRSLAQAQIQSGGTQKPSFGLSARDPNRARYNKILAQEYQKDPDALAAGAAFKAGSANLTQLTKLQGQIGSFEDAFESDLENAREAAKSVPRSQSKKWNSFEQMMRANLTDYPELAAFSVAAQTAVNQYSRLVSSATAGGTSTDTARHEAMAILDKAMATGSFDAALNMMEKEARNRVKGIQDQIDSQQKKLSRNGRNTLSAPPSSSGSQKDDPLGILTH